MTLKALVLRACTLLPLLAATATAKKNGSTSIGMVRSLSGMSFKEDIEIYIISREIGLVKSKVNREGLKGAAAFSPQMLATHSFDNPPPLDVLLIPGGILADEDDQALNAFIAEQYPTLEYLLSVCTGARNLADAGVLEGKRATSNKAVWETVVTHGKNVTWVPTARWVSDGNIWTSSGVAAGIDMMYAFFEHYYSDNKEAVQSMINGVEYAPHADSHWDPFSIVHNFRAQMHGNVNFLTDAAERFTALARQYTDVCHDLERERVAARATQQSTEKLEAELKELKEATMKNGGFESVVGAGGFPTYHVPSPTTTSAPPVSYAARAAPSHPAAAVPASKPRYRPTFGSVDKSIILINAYGHRIDMPLPPRSGTVAESFNRKTHIGGKRRREAGDAAQAPGGEVP
ncbi:class I glutamine amidotransferase-like protein [Chaetomium fimeti]|uniref:Class I glutamine amidotransferase-like protein n=1 Tax=Chaetomium fimeti TaxID=1854472 RepID=A0AAE0LQI8_9PEZI|nr:class I glutamine amidotransferase-like protein [Chaetomium fimeti]